jgi:hypothetical protein
MAKYKVRVSDTITLAREWTIEIEAEDEDAAMEAAIDKALDVGPPNTCMEDQIDNTPYEAVIVEG